jgi:hypothetical protein
MQLAVGVRLANSKLALQAIKNGTGSIAQATAALLLCQSRLRVTSAVVH